MTEHSRIRFTGIESAIRTSLPNTEINGLMFSLVQVVDHYKDLSASFQEFSQEEDMEPTAPKEE